MWNNPSGASGENRLMLGLKLGHQQYEVINVHVLRIAKVRFYNLCAALTGVTKLTGEYGRCQSSAVCERPHCPEKITVFGEVSRKNVF